MESLKSSLYFAKKIFLQNKYCVLRYVHASNKSFNLAVRALCRQHSSNLFFHQLHLKKKKIEKKEAKAKAVCSGCPVKIECLEEANEIAEPFGVWGGLKKSKENAKVFT